MIQSYEAQLKEAYQRIKEAEVVIIGGASGLSTANGHDFYNFSDYFKKHFMDFHHKFGVMGCFQSLYYKYPNRESRWAYLSRHATAMFDEPAGQTYENLFKLIGDKEYFVITTNQDMQFSKVFDESKIAYPQGDAHWLQCSRPCHDEVYPAEEAVRKMAASIHDCQVDPETIPTCPKCGADLEPWIRSYEFLEGIYWADKLGEYENFVVKNHNRKILFIEMGVGRMTPNIIKYPFSKMVNLWPNASLIRINQNEDFFPEMKEGKATIFEHDIATTLYDLVQLKQQDQEVNNG